MDEHVGARGVPEIPRWALTASTRAETSGRRLEKRADAEDEKYRLFGAFGGPWDASGSAAACGGAGGASDAAPLGEGSGKSDLK